VEVIQDDREAKIDKIENLGGWKPAPRLRDSSLVIITIPFFLFRHHVPTIDSFSHTVNFIYSQFFLASIIHALA